MLFDRNPRWYAALTDAMPEAMFGQNLLSILPTFKTIRRGLLACPTSLLATLLILTDPPFSFMVKGLFFRRGSPKEVPSGPFFLMIWTNLADSIDFIIGKSLFMGDNILEIKLNQEDVFLHIMYVLVVNCGVRSFLLHA